MEEGEGGVQDNHHYSVFEFLADYNSYNDNNSYNDYNATWNTMKKSRET